MILSLEAPFDCRTKYIRLLWVHQMERQKIGLTSDQQLRLQQWRPNWDLSKTHQTDYTISSTYSFWGTIRKEKRSTAKSRMLYVWAISRADWNNCWRPLDRTSKKPGRPLAQKSWERRRENKRSGWHQQHGQRQTRGKNWNRTPTNVRTSRRKKTLEHSTGKPTIK